MKILFVIDKRVNAGSIQAVANYVRAGDALGHTIALYGERDPDFPNVRFSTDVRAFDFVLFIIESGFRWMSRLQLAHILSSIPRHRRAVLDTDGMYNQLLLLDHDRNHATERDRSEWLAQHAALSNLILQPACAPSEAGMVPLPFFGYDPALQISAKAAPEKQFDIIHVGHNWWRWHEMSTCLLPAIERIRAQLGDICFVGSWWDAAPRWAGFLNLEAAFRVDSDRLRRLCVQVKPPVPYTQVIPTMSQGRVTIMTQRPLLRHLKLLTSKYFEILCADTIPLVMLHPDDAEAVYGPAGRELTLYGEIEDKLLDALNHPQKYQEIVKAVRHHLLAYHSYSNRVQELVRGLSHED